MATLNSELAPNPQESLADYVRRLRTSLSLSQKDLAERAGIHLQSVGKIERGETTRLKHKAKTGLACAFGISIEYLDAVCKGVTLDVIETLKFCPQCWISGSVQTRCGPQCERSTVMLAAPNCAIAVPVAMRRFSHSSLNFVRFAEKLTDDRLPIEARQKLAEIELLVQIAFNQAINLLYSTRYAACG